MSSGGAWVFGYGSLVSPTSFAATLGRPLTWGVDLFEAELGGYGRRWNYGVMHSFGVGHRGDGVDREWTVVALGLVAAADEAANGVVAWVDDDELPALDHRERAYDRVDVTDLVSIEGRVDGAVATYVPRRAAIDHYEVARRRASAAIEQRYWDLVDGAFAALGTDRHQRYHSTTPPPDIPVLPLRRERRTEPS